MRSCGNRKLEKKATESWKNRYIPAESRKATPSYRPSLFTTFNIPPNSDSQLGHQHVK